MRVAERVSSALVAVACSTTLFVNAPSLAVGPPPSLNDAIVELSEAAHPILRAQTESFGPFQDRVGNVLLKKIKPEKLTKALNLGLDAFESVPAAQVEALESQVKSAFSGLSAENCDLVPLPPPALLAKFQASDAVSRVDPAKLERFQGKYAGVFKGIAKTSDSTAICLPAADKLDKLALAQAEVGRAFGKEESKQFAVWTEAMLKSSIGVGDVLPLVDDAKKLAPKATTVEKLRFQKAGKTVENAAKGEAAKARMAEQQARKEAVASASEAKTVATQLQRQESNTAGMTAAQRAAAESAARRGSP